MLEVTGLPLPAEVVKTAAVSGGAAVVATIVLRFEVELPFSICMLVIPPVTGLGMALAIWLQFWMGLSLYATWGVLGLTLLGLVCCYEGFKRLKSDPRPPPVRYG